MSPYKDYDYLRDLFIILLIVIIISMNFITHINNKRIDDLSQTVQKMNKMQNDINEMNLLILNHMIEK